MSERQVLQLDNFYISKLHIDWEDASDKVTKFKVYVDYSVQQHKELKDKFKLNFSFRGSTMVNKKKSGFFVDTDMCGFFTFPEGYDEDEKQVLIRVNGLTILYGILRGQIALCTGSFPEGKITLPTLNMFEIVKKAEAKLEKKVSDSTSETIEIHDSPE